MSEKKKKGSIITLKGADSNETAQITFKKPNEALEAPSSRTVNEVTKERFKNLPNPVTTIKGKDKITFANNAPKPTVLPIILEESPPPPEPEPVPEIVEKIEERKKNPSQYESDEERDNLNKATKLHRTLVPKKLELSLTMVREKWKRIFLNRKTQLNTLLPRGVEKDALEQYKDIESFRQYSLHFDGEKGASYAKVASSLQGKNVGDGEVIDLVTEEDDLVKFLPEEEKKEEETAQALTAQELEKEAEEEIRGESKEEEEGKKEEEVKEEEQMEEPPKEEVIEEPPVDENEKLEARKAEEDEKEKEKEKEVKERRKREKKEKKEKEKREKEKERLRSELLHQTLLPPSTATTDETCELKPRHKEKKEVKPPRKERKKSVKPDKRPPKKEKKPPKKESRRSKSTKPRRSQRAKSSSHNRRSRKPSERRRRRRYSYSSSSYSSEEGLNFSFRPNSPGRTEVTFMIEPDCQEDPWEFALRNRIFPVICSMMPPCYVMRPPCNYGPSYPYCC